MSSTVPLPGKTHVKGHAGECHFCLALARATKGLAALEAAAEHFAVAQAALRCLPKETNTARMLIMLFEKARHAAVVAKYAVEKEEAVFLQEDGGGDAGKPRLSPSDVVRLKNLPADALVGCQFGAEYNLGGWVVEWQDRIDYMRARKAREIFGC